MRLLLLCLALSPLVAAADYSNHPKTPELLQTLREEFRFSKADLNMVREALVAAERVPKLIESEKNAKEKTLTWADYRPIHVNPKNIERGAAFYHAQRDWLDKAQQQYGVPASVIVAIMGVETKYGGYTGPHRVLDSLATQGFDHPTRHPFFFRELTEFFVFCRDFGKSPTEPVGSYAGAMGMAQFMPSNYRRLAVDYDNDGDIDLWSIPDAIGSIGNYLIHYRPSASWQAGEPVTVPATLRKPLASNSVALNGRRPDSEVGKLQRLGVEPAMAVSTELAAGLLELDGDNGLEHWLALPNFYSIMAYNPRVFYAMSVAQLAQGIEVAANAP